MCNLLLSLRHCGATTYQSNSAETSDRGAGWLRQRHHLSHHKSLHCKVKIILKLLSVVSVSYMKTMGTAFSSQVILTGAHLT